MMPTCSIADACRQQFTATHQFDVCGLFRRDSKRVIGNQRAGLDRRMQGQILAPAARE
jgi:hypothetical protein